MHDTTHDTHTHTGRIDFGPTYKYQPGTDNYERREGKKKRIPAWCGPNDRYDMPNDDDTPRDRNAVMIAVVTLPTPTTGMSSPIVL